MNRMMCIAVLAVTACGPMDDELDPSQPVVDGVVDEGDLAEDQSALGARPIMRMPFRCGQVWLAQTRSNHSPQLAVDFNRDGDFGDDVIASAAGRVTRSESEGNVSYGNWIEIEHSGGYRTRYAHLRVRLVGVGARVQMGQKIGEVGNTGGSSGPHLHYEQLAGSTPVRVKLGGNDVRYFETRAYRSRNSCP